MFLAVHTRGEPWFVNVAPASGLDGLDAREVVMVDLDGDGWLDLVLDDRWFLRSCRGGAWFQGLEGVGLDRPEVEMVTLTPDGDPDCLSARVEGLRPRYLYFADVDEDGDTDALWGVRSTWEHFDGEKFVAVPEADHGIRSRVYLNDGTGRFTRGPESAYTVDAGPAMALAICDVDRDGDLDLFEGREYRTYGVLEDCGIDRLWLGDGTGRFTDATTPAGLLTSPVPGGPDSSRPTYGVTHADLDGDGDQDLLALSYGRQWNRQWLNQGDGTFVDIGDLTTFDGDEIRHGHYPEWVRARGREDEQPFRSNGNTFDCAVGDVNGDLALDLLLGEIAHGWAGDSSDRSSLLVQREGGFERRPLHRFLSPRLRRDPDRWNEGDLRVAMGDFDNDGRLDLLVASGDYPDGQFLRIYRQPRAGGVRGARSRG